jgi:hypothetical protein
MKHLFTVLFTVSFAAALAQENCSFSQDTVFIPKDNKVVDGDYLQTTLKNKSVVQLFRTPMEKYYLKLIVTENLYFGKVDMLEIKSGKKSFYAKDTRHYQYDKHTGFYIVEVFKNYVGTLKDEGITSIVFGKAETDFCKQDCNQVKQISKCFYESIAAKK